MVAEGSLFTSIGSEKVRCMSVSDYYHIDPHIIESMSRLVDKLLRADDIDAVVYLFRAPVHLTVDSLILKQANKQNKPV